MKALKFTILFFAILFTFSACKEKYSSRTISVYSAEATYWGQLYGDGLDVYDLYFLDNGLSYDNNGKLKGSGTLIYFDLSMPLNSFPIPSGSYRPVAQNNTTTYTFIKGGFDSNNKPIGSYIASVNNGQITGTKNITGGELIITKNANYAVNATLTTDDGAPYQFTYNGPIKMKDVAPLPSSFVKGELWYYGNVKDTKLNTFTIYLGGSDVNFSTYAGNNDILRIDIYTPNTYTTEIPDGKYPVKINVTENQTVVDGFVDTNNNEQGTWYYTTEKFPITGGHILVGKTGSTYTINFSLIAKTGMPISGTYKGELGYYDKTKTAGVKQALRAKSAESTHVRPTGKNYLDIRTSR